MFEHKLPSKQDYKSKTEYHDTQGNHRLAPR
jgi:hypothetical protein